LRPGVVFFNRKLYFDCPSSHIHDIKGSVQRKLRPIVRYWPGYVALGNIFFFNSKHSSCIKDITIFGQSSKISRRFREQQVHCSE
jgi:hypothetical protein